ncbi:tRNA pseudouridine synthase A [Fundidesulfovibrio magnetotacticus]|uniref:tRNA pseudouridine synthase A n=1 Tax=Fundidesulfovibrio magnetotacticus TaxID=2730080 RepID=A0A6V8LU50_9BACT|nr:tRNA pseudouridine(38-40) synthase TruA [Fundidesulfovibrio magnetotacticus]GFK93858.1 tRNA pseudouridine synthase A [Fundidesulfovibrio magnetotacticus]
MEPTLRLKCTLAYQGTDFAGWQYQPEGRGRSVQACLEEALARLAGRPVRAHGASRTDAGVHALHQVAHADVPAARAHLPWRRALNALLPRDMAVLAAEEVSREFHARYDATAKTYAYTFWLEQGFLLPQRRPFVWDAGSLDLDAMDEAAQAFVGSHDFAAFQNAGTPVADTVREVFSITRHPGPTPHEAVFRVRGGGFLKQMVRNIMGCLALAGQGKANAQTVRSLLETKDRTLAPATAPARGLCLEHMEFGGRGRKRRHQGPDGDPGEHLPDQERLGGL